MRIVLISPPRENVINTNLPSKLDQARGYAPPLGLLYIASYIKQHSHHSITVIDCGVEEMSYPALKQKILELKPGLVGIQVLSFTLIDSLKTAAMIKEISLSTLIALGGPHITAYPKESLKNKNVDYVVVNEGEISFTSLADSVGNFSELATIPGIGFKNGNELILTRESSFIADLNTLAIPDRRLTPYIKYYSILSHNSPITTMMTSRGCPYQCIFCERMGKKFRALSPQRVIEEIEDCLNLGIKEILFHDDTFTIDKKRVFEVCGAITRRGLKFDWSARARVDTVNYDLLLAMKKAGCKRLSFGVESANQKILNNLRKGITIEQVEKVFGYTKKLRIKTLADFMIGSPGETKKDIEDTIRFAKKLRANYVQFSLTTPFPGTDLYREALLKGIIKSDVWKDYAENPKSDFTPPLWTENISREELLNLLSIAYKTFYLSTHFVYQELSTIRSFADLSKKVNAGLKLLKRHCMYT